MLNDQAADFHTKFTLEIDIQPVHPYLSSNGRVTELVSQSNAPASIKNAF